MIKDLEENILNNKQIAQKYNCSISLVENFNSCKYHNNLHNYKKNIRREANNMISNCINEYTIIKNGICSINIINTKGRIIRNTPKTIFVSRYL